MKLDQITLRRLRMTLRSPFETSFGRISTRDCLLIEARSGDLVGYGECVADNDPGYSYETCQTAWHILEDFILPAVLRQDFAEPGDIQAKMDFVRGHLMAKAGLEMALWDLKGKQERSLAQRNRRRGATCREGGRLGWVAGITASPGKDRGRLS